jgi:AcrR family transcriptional regulator
MPTSSTPAAAPKASRHARVQRRQERTRTALLTAARRLFALNGVETTTIAEIAQDADIAVGSFYNYFATKDDLLAALLEQALTEQLALLESRQAQVESPAEAIAVAHRHLIALADSDPDLAWLLVRLDVPDRIAHRVFWQSALDDLRRGIELGCFQVADMHLALIASGGALLSIIHSMLDGELTGEVGCAHAEGVLRSFGLPAEEAARIARRPLPNMTRGVEVTGGG